MRPPALWHTADSLLGVAVKPARDVGVAALLACGSDQVPVPIEASLTEVTAAVARVLGGNEGAR
jgi:hypothetical protein